MKLTGKEDSLSENGGSHTTLRRLFTKKSLGRKLKRVGSELEDVAVQDLVELVATHDDPLSNEDLIELQNNPIYDEEEQVEEKVSCSGGIQNALSKIYSDLDILQSIDNNDDRALTVC
ncbi:hypothetical protein WA026_014932 [Henosepilachna vigintioctopunctata]|uniref:Uncharacterized protein n=1 Tax=Henosepilachna vigintioctopunctata TaxID=420089 RepID=A0AAW1V1M4_9CUCU